MGLLLKTLVQDGIQLGPFTDKEFVAGDAALGDVGGDSANPELEAIMSSYASFRWVRRGSKPYPYGLGGPLGLGLGLGFRVRTPFFRAFRKGLCGGHCALSRSLTLALTP